MAAAGWYDVTWPYRKQLTIHAAQVVDNLLAFPVLVQLSTDADLASLAKANGYDILFTGSDGVTKLDHEIDKYTSASGALIAWVKVPALSSATDTVLYMYYGNAAAANQQNVTGVWSSSYGAVWHLDESAAPYADVTSNANNSTGGTYPVQVDAKINKGQSFNGTSHVINIPASASIELSNNGTVSAWFQFSASKQSDLLEKGGANGYTLWQDNAKIWWGKQNTGVWATSTVSYTIGQWYKVDGVVEAGVMRLYINGALNVSSGSSGSFTNTGTLQIGNGMDGRYTGLLDELRISNVVRTAQWIATEYNNQASPGTFYALGSQTQVPTVTFTSASQSALEGAGSMTITAQLSAAAVYDVTVPFTVGGSASNPADYAISASPITIPAGSTTANITIGVVDDAIDEPDETVIVTMGNPTSALQGATTTHTATILDNDSAGVTVTESGGSTDIAEGGATDTYMIVLNSQLTADVVITVTPDVQASVGADAGVARTLTFTSANWNAPQTVTVTATDDPDVEGSHTSTITHTAASVDPYYSGITVAGVIANITDNDAAGVIVTESGGSTDVTEGGATDSYTIVLNSRPTDDVTVTATPDAESSVGSGGGVARQLTFTSANWNTPQAVIASAVDDALVEGLHTSTITHSATSVDGNYNGIVVALVTAHITDNDTAGITATPTSGLATTEVGGTAQFTLVLNTQPTADVSISLSSSNTAEGTVSPAGLTFTPANWSTPQTVTITGVDDAIQDGNVAYSIVTGAAVSSDLNFNGVNPADISVTNLDNDAAGVAILESDGSTSVVEGGSTDTYTIRLNTEPTGNVAVAVMPDGQLDVGAGAGVAVTLIFTPLDWDAPQTVTVAGLPGSYEAAEHKATISHVASSADSKYNAIPISMITVLITYVGGSDPIDQLPDEVTIAYTTMHYGLCGATGCVPLLLGIPCLLGMKKRGPLVAAKRTRSTSGSGCAAPISRH